MAMTIDFFGEISCPWCLIALHRLDNVLERDFAGLEVNVRHHPFLLTQGLPKDGIAVDDIFRARHDGADRRESFEPPEREARSAGIDLSLSRQPRVFDTTAAQTLVRLAHARGTQHALAVALTDAYFLRGVTIGDFNAVASLASEHGFDHAEALALMRNPAEQRLTIEQSDAARNLGLRSVPVIAFPNGLALQTSPESAIAEAISKNISGIA